MKYIDGNDLYQMFYYGSHYVTKQREVLNDINVFPVPDGDTGNNLVHTMQTISRETKVCESFYQTLESMSDSALVGARGNSGIIFAQFVNGLLKSAVKKAKISIPEFTHMALNSIKYIYQALANPVEGTMLTVMKDWARELNSKMNQVDSVEELFRIASIKAEISLKKTKEQLSVLKEHKVVDSGALGFVVFLQGINSYYNHDELEIEVNEHLEMNHQHVYTENVLFRYCTEGLVRFDEVDESEVKAALQVFGDSLIVVVGARMFRIHIHTNEPEKVFQVLRTFGEVITQKVDDMILDMALNHSTEDVVLVTDSIADIDQSFLQENNICVLPVNIEVDKVMYKDKLTINNQILFNLIEEGIEYPTSSTPTMMEIRQLFKKLTVNFKKVMVILVASALSATYETVKKEAESFNQEGYDIRVIDSYTNSVTEGLLVYHARQLLKEGKGMDEVVEIIEEKKKQTNILVCLETFKYAMMSGRLPKVVGKIGMFFGIRPIMTLNHVGKGTAFGFGLSQKGITRKIVKMMKKELKHGTIESYALIHCLNPELLAIYRDIFTKLIGKPPLYETEVSSATSIHSGKGSVAIGYIRHSS